MFDSFMEGTKYYDYPSFDVAVFSLLLSLALSTVVAYTYKYTRAEDFYYSRSFFQALVLSAVVTAMIMMAVGSNLAVGFGIIGAVAIIRFRTNIQNPRNVMFIFASLAVGVATGVYGYAISVAGTLIFCLTAYLLYLAHRGESDYKYEIICQSGSRETVEEIKKYLFSVSKSLEESELRKRVESDNRYEYLIWLKNDVDVQEVFEHLNNIPDLSSFRIIKKQISDQL